MEDLEPCEIFLVEDNSSETELILRILKKNKITEKVSAFKDGITTLQYIYSNLEQRNLRALPKVIFLDLKLPRLDGLDVLKKVKSDSRIRHIPVVMLTSSDDETLMKECYLAGANSYIIKPLQYNLFLEYINKLVRYWTKWNKLPI